MKDNDLSALPVAEIRYSRWPSPIWLVPLAALLVGAWLLYQNWYKQGPIIEVRFPSAEGIVEGQTVIRYRHVVVGRVDKVYLEEQENRQDLLPVVRMRLNSEVADLLNCDAQFWVVRPRIRGAEISGLGTLFSGTYIGMLLNKEGSTGHRRGSLFESLCYEALEEAPFIKPEQPGRQFILEAESMGSIDIGTPLFYKQVKVGEVIDYRILRESGKVELKIFIEDPYFTFVNANTRFWNASGMEFKMNSSGAEFRMESISSLLAGGIAFENTDALVASGAGSPADSRFTLFKSYKDSLEKQYKDRLYYVMYFDGSVRGLTVGAPVEYQGIPVGKVENIAMNMDKDSLDVRILVLVSIEPQRFAEDITLAQSHEMMEGLVRKGVRAKLQSGNLLTGQMYVALSRDKNVAAAQIEVGQFHSIFPTSPTPVEELSRMAVGIADDLKGTLAEIRRFMESRQLDKTVVQANTALTDASKMMQEAERALNDLRGLIQVAKSQTLPSVTKDVTRVSDAIVSVSGGVNKAIPSVTQSVSSVASVVNKAIPEVSHSVVSVANSVNKAIPEVSHSVVSVANSVNKAIPEVSHSVVSVTNSVNKALPQVTNTLNKAGQDVTRVSNDLVMTMRKLQVSLGHMDRLLAQNSPTQYQLMEMMEEVTAASRAVRELSERLERQPDALIRGRR